MLRFIAALAGMSCLVSMGPALAQSGPQPNFQNRFSNLENRIEVGLQSGAITRTEAAPLRDQLRLVQQLERRLAPAGLTQAERNQVQTRLQSLREQISTAELNDYARPGTSDEDPWPGEADDRGGRGRYGREAGAVLGADDHEENDEGGGDRNGHGGRGYLESRSQVRVGGRVPGHFGGVPRELRNEFPETMPYTYRFGDGRVYQVERRTGVIVRIYEAGGW